MKCYKINLLGGRKGRTISCPTNSSVGDNANYIRNNQIWKCQICQRQKTKFNAIKIHMGVMQCETKHKDLHCPHCDKLSKHIGNLRHHIFSEKCKHPRPNITNETLADIVARNTPEKLDRQEQQLILYSLSFVKKTVRK